MAAPRTRVLLVANPASRRGAALVGAARGAFRASRARCDTVATEHPGHAGELAARLAERYDATFVLGGDGTVMEVIDALAGTGHPVGILPGGTGNLIARALGVPMHVPTAARALLEGEVAWIDLGEVRSAAGRRRFAFAAGVGVDAAMIEHTPAWLKRRLGVAAYALTAARAALRRELFRVRATVDGVVVEREAAAVMVANFGAVLRSLITLGPGIEADDGRLDLCIVSPRTLRDAVRVLARMLRGDFGTDDCLFYRPGKTFLIETDGPRRAQADGELLGATPLEIRVLPRAATLLVPSG